MDENLREREVPSKSPATIAQYQNIYRRLEKRAEKETQCGTPVAPAQIARLFVKYEATWQAATARLYRAAIIYVFERLQSRGALGIPEARAALLARSCDEETARRLREQLREERRDAKRRSPRTATQKVKRFSKQDAEKLLEDLLRARSRWGRLAARWFFVGSLTGLRPAEWKDVRIGTDERGQEVLLVRNAKSTNGRAHSEYRTLSLAGLSDNQRAAVLVHVGTVRSCTSAGQFERLYDACRQIVRRKADALWPRRARHPSLYTARHMFAADAKAMFDQVTVAALMGHASAETAGKHYAPAWSGRGGLGVEPSKKDIQAVMRRNPDFPRKPGKAAANTAMERLVPTPKRYGR